VKRRPTIIDVARDAGVSKSTVSRVISNNGAGVRDETRLQVERAIEKLGYAHNAVASSLRTDRTNIILLAIPDITNPFWPDVARGVQDVMDREGYAVVFANNDWQGQRERMFLWMARRNRFDGIVINPIAVSEAELRTTAIPAVLIGSREGYANFDMVGSQSYQATRLALDHLAQLGHRRIGFIYGQGVSRLGYSRLNGYLDFLQEIGLSKRDEYIVQMPFDRAGGFQGMQQLLSLPQPPTAVFAANDILAMGALQAAHQAGVPVPQELSIIGMDDIFAASTTTPPLTTVIKPKYQIGQHAAYFLLDRIHKRGPAEPRRKFLACQLQVRGSTGPSPA
jgi:LacI family transcriptional regulator